MYVYFNEFEMILRIAVAVCLIWLVTASGAYQDASPLTAVYTDEPWDVDGPCQIYVEVRRFPTSSEKH